MPMNPRVVIIGAGAAGYAAGCKLLEHGVTNIRILEAENRIGGRVHSVEFGAGMVDLGAQWCHGEKNNIVFEMVSQLNLLQPSQASYKEFLFINSKGNFVDSNISNELITLLMSIASDNEQLKTQKGSLGEYIIKKYEEKLSSDYPEINRELAKQIMDWFHQLINNLNCSPNWFDISCKGLTEYEECEGNLTLNWKDKGYKTIFSVLKKELPNPKNALPIDDKIIFNKEVSRIIWEDYGKKKDREIKVECADGTSYKADHVIVTVSLAVLKESHKTLFVPELPAYKRIAIQGLAIGVVNKILLKFPHKWWPDDCTGFDLIWSEEDLRKIPLECPEATNQNGRSWLESIFGFHPVDCNPNVLLAFVNGDLASEIESLPEDTIVQGCMYLLKKFLGKHFDIPIPDSIKRSTWSTNRHFRGSYSYRSLETERLKTSAADLAKPLGENAVLFAGEATHSFFYSTVHGAVESGFREAHRIISHYRSGNKNKARL